METEASELLCYIYRQPFCLSFLHPVLVCLACLPVSHLGGDLASAVPCDSPTASHATATNTHSACTGNKARTSAGAVILTAVKSDTWLCSTKQVTKKENYSVIHKLWRKGAEQNALFITVCCLLCLVLLPSFPTIQILPFSLYHLSHTEVRMGMTQQGYCFVVLFYLFLDNEKSAEGLAWCLLPHIYTHETLPRPYGLSTGDYLTLLTLWHHKH